MKRNLLILIVLFSTMTMMAQNGKISYQAVVRDSENKLVYNTELQVTVALANSATGAAVYSEQHTVTSNANGLISLLIGGSDEVLPGSDWNAVQWNTAWVTATIRKVEGQTLVAEHHLPLSAVPYALYADFADSVNLQVLQDYLDEHHYVTESDLPTVEQSDWEEDDEESPAFIKNKPNLSVYATNAHLNDTLADYATTNALKDSLSRYVDNKKLNDTLDAYYTKDNVDVKLNEYEKKSELCGDVKECIKDTLKQYTTSDQIDTLLGAYYDTTQVKTAIHDTADVLRNMMVDAANDGQLTIIAAGDTTRFTANQATNDTVRLNKFATKDTLAYYATTDALKDSLTHYVSKAKLNDTLSKYTTTDKIDTIVNKHHFLTSDSALIVRMRDSIQKVNAHVSADSLVLAEKIRQDSIDLAKHISDSTRMVFDTLHTYYATKDTLKNFLTINGLCDSVMKCEGIKALQTADNNLSDRIKADSLNLLNFKTKVHDDSVTITSKIRSDSSTVHGALVDSLKHYLDSTQVVRSIHDSIGNGKLSIQYGTNPAVQFGANQDTITTFSIPVPPEPTYGTLTIKRNELQVGTFTANETKEININVPTCDSLANCDFINNILDRLDKLERQNDSLARELDKLKPALTLTASHDTVTVCKGSTYPVTYTATFHNCSSSDYTIFWKVNGTDSSNVKTPTFTFNAPDTEGNYEVVCVATRAGNPTVTDTVTTTVFVDNDIPTFDTTVHNLTVELSGITNTATIQWDTDSLPVAFTGSSATKTYSVADTVTITATSERGCTLSKQIVLQPTKPTVTTDSIPTGTITVNTAFAYGAVTSDGGRPNTKRGVVYDTSNTNLKLGAEGVDSVMSGTGKGSFTCNLKRLIPCTQYYVRAFAINDVDTVYGEVKGFTTSSFSCGSTLFDIDGNDYETILLGSQCWMKQNLRVTHYANGDTIPINNTVSPSTSPFRYAPDSNLTTYGYCYNWAAAMHSSTSSSLNPSGVQGACPNGWHLPSDAEWIQLSNFVASNSDNVCDNNPNFIIKALASQEDWCNPGQTETGCLMCDNPSANNNTGFSVLPAGTWNNAEGDHGTIYLKYSGGYSIFTSATELEDPLHSDFVHAREYYTENAYVDYTSISKTIGLSVRCVLDTCQWDETAYLPTVSAVTLSNTGSATVNMAASVLSDGGANVTKRGVCWSTTQHFTPTSTTDHADATSGGVGDFTVTGNLDLGTTYYMRAYATNSAGTAYGAEVAFVMPNLPTVTTAAVTEILANAATTGGEVTADGGSSVTARGVCWSTSADPTIADNYTTDSSGLGSFVSHLTNLTPTFTYYVRAYATNAVGTTYGEVKTVTTPAKSISLTSDRTSPIKMCGAPSQTVTYTATPSYVGDYNFNWSCSGTVSGTANSNTYTVTYTSADNYTVSCAEEIGDVSNTISTEVLNEGVAVSLAMCSEDLWIYSKEVTETAPNLYNVAEVNAIYWGDGDSTVREHYYASFIVLPDFSHQYQSPGVYTVTVVSNDNNSNCEVTRQFAMGDVVMSPCMVAVPHTNASTYTHSSGGLETTDSEGKVTRVADNDTSTYKVVQIGSQCWMAENLRTRYKPDGTEIEDGGTTTSSSVAYRYNPLNGASVNPYGYFYNWTAVMNGADASDANPSGVRGICPLGWHVPSDAEWTELVNTVQGSAAKLATGCAWKADMATHSYDPPIGGVHYEQKLTPGDYYYPQRDSSGFDALPADWTGESNNYNTGAYFWTSSTDGNSCIYRIINHNYKFVDKSSVLSTGGYSLRCVRDEGYAEQTSLPTVTTEAALNIEKTSATLNGSVTIPDGVTITEQGFEWKAASDGGYTRITLAVDVPLSYNLAGLTSNTDYTFRAFASTENSTVYGSEVDFTTTGIVVTTAAASDVEEFSATLNGSIVNTSSDIITAQGFEWKVSSDGSYTHDVSVSGTTLTYNLAGLTPNTAYTFRTFATTAEGSIYGSEMNFTTSTHLIDLSTLITDYEAKDRDTLINTLVNPVKVSIAANARVTLRGATIDGTDYNTDTYSWAGISCEEGDATIILEGTNTVKGFYEDYPGVYVAENKTLTIQGTGTLNANSNGAGAGIGGGWFIPCGNIIINGGIINATGGEDAAGIGGGGVESCGSITINNGTIHANGGSAAAGIGGGYAGSCGGINITGGTIEATGGGEAAGIGAGQDAYAYSGNIIISGGNVTAQGGVDAAGIGTGSSVASSSTCGSIIISDGEVAATGGNYAAGIGSGLAYGESNSCDSIRISGGTVIATGGQYAAGIGSGFAYNNDNSCGNIVINGATADITAEGGELGPGVGAGIGMSATSRCQNITISGGTVNAIGAGNQNGAGAGIGTGGSLSSGYSRCGNITIYNSVTSVNAVKGGSNAENSIGRGKSVMNSCGTVTIGGTIDGTINGTIYWDGSDYQNGGDDPDTGLKHSPYVYPQP